MTEQEVDRETGEILTERDNGSHPRQLAHEAFEALERAPHIWEVTETVTRKRIVVARGAREAVDLYERLDGVAETPLTKRAISASDKGPAERQG
ncbi:MAG: hypothetical protein PHQ60_16390 [Sideroxydans sp.]|nr:hypothetical protein [Sideroxydans sp.]